MKEINSNLKTYSKLYWYNQNNKRYYIVRRTYDLFGDLILIQEWGGASRIGGKIINVYCPTRKFAADYIKQIIRRRKQRGYGKPKINKKPFII